jgi:hypothetical protein
MTYYTFADQARAFERSAARGIAYEADDKLEDMQRAINDTVSGLRQIFECIGSQPWLEDTLAKLIDAAADIQTACHRDMSVLLWRLPVLDLSEAYNLLQEIEK